MTMKRKKPEYKKKTKWMENEGKGKPVSGKSTNISLLSAP